MERCQQGLGEHVGNLITHQNLVDGAAYAYSELGKVLLEIDMHCMFSPTDYAVAPLEFFANQVGLNQGCAQLIQFEKSCALAT